MIYLPSELRLLGISSAIVPQAPVDVELWAPLLSGVACPRRFPCLGRDVAPEPKHVKKSNWITKRRTCRNQFDYRKGELGKETEVKQENCKEGRPVKILEPFSYIIM